MDTYSKERKSLLKELEKFNRKEVHGGTTQCQNIGGKCVSSIDAACIHASLIIGIGFGCPIAYNVCVSQSAPSFPCDP